MKFEYRVVVDTDTLEHARQVMSERICVDEEYEDDDGNKFDYVIDYYTLKEV